MKISIKTILGVLFALVLFTGCDKDDNTEPEPQPSNDLILINSATTDIGDMEVSVFAKDSLMAEYTDLYIKVQNAAGNFLSASTITIQPMMDMGSMMHSAPAENPAGTATDNLFEGAAVFTMPGEMGWSLNISVYDPAQDISGMASIPVAVKAPPKARVRNVMPLDSSNALVVAYLQPQEPIIGANPMEITIHRKASMMEFNPVDDITVEMYPEMVAMGHSSPNNEDPTSTGMGHYEGNVNFTMSGDWRINLKLIENGAVIDSTTYFDITF